VCCFTHIWAMYHSTTTTTINNKNNNTQHKTRSQAKIKKRQTNQEKENTQVSEITKH
jgi:hypothetical protein